MRETLYGFMRRTAGGKLRDYVPDKNHKPHTFSDEEGNCRFDETIDEFESGESVVNIDFPISKDDSGGKSWEILKEKAGYYDRYPEKRSNRNI